MGCPLCCKHEVCSFSAKAGHWVNRNTAVRVFDAVFADDGDVDAYVAEHGLEQVSDTGLVQTVVEKVLSANPKSVEDYKAGKEKAFGFLVGQTMRELKGQASPQVVNETLRSLLGQQETEKCV